MSKNKKLDTLTNGIVKNNPVFRLVLGTCPTLAVTTSAINGLGMGLATTFVLICSNFLISLLRKVIPDKVRIPAFVLIIATFVTIIQMVMRKYIPDLYESLGIYIPLIVVNCIILARAEAFASMNPVLDSALDGLGMGVGFTLSLGLMGLLREFFGAGEVFGVAIPGLSDYAMSVFLLPAGGFIMFGMLMALMNFLTKKADIKRKLKAEQQALAEHE
jgi:electron transport complex protein RnfE